MKVYKGQDYLQQSFREHNNTSRIFPYISGALFVLFIIVTPIAFKNYLAKPTSSSIIILLLSFGLVTTFFATVKSILTSTKKKRDFQRGIEAEEYLQATLEKKLREGFTYFTNISINGKFDIDSILVGPYGIFIIESKNYSGINEYRDGKWLKNGDLIPHNPFKQLFSNQKELQQLLHEHAIDLPICPRLYWHNQYGKAELQVSKEYEKYIWRKGQTVKMFNDIFTKEKCDKQQLNKALECVKKLI